MTMETTRKPADNLTFDEFRNMTEIAFIYKLIDLDLPLTVEQGYMLKGMAFFRRIQKFTHEGSTLWAVTPKA